MLSAGRAAGDWRTMAGLIGLLAIVTAISFLVFRTAERSAQALGLVLAAMAVQFVIDA